MALTKISDLVNPMVMADAISARIEKKITVSPFAKIDDCLAGVPGDTVYVPRYSYIGDASEVGEGIEVDTTKLVASTTPATVKKAMKAVELSDEAVLSGYGNPIGETNNQLAAAIAAAREDAEKNVNIEKLKIQARKQAETVVYKLIEPAIDGSKKLVVK